MKEKSTELETEVRVSNAADNADITQSHARDTRHCRMQEVNSLCTNSGSLRANSVLCHSTQYSLVVVVVVVEVVVVVVVIIIIMYPQACR